MTTPGSASYSGDPASSRTDAVRSLLGDTGGPDGNDFILTNEEIAYFDSLVTPSYDDPFMTAAVCADIIAGRYAGEASISADGVSIAMESLQQKYRDMAANLRETYKQIAGPGGYPLVGGIDAFTVLDPTVRPMQFTIAMDDNYRAGDQAFSRQFGYSYGDWMESEPW